MPRVSRNVLQTMTADHAPMSTRSVRAIHRPRAAVLGWLLAVGSMAAGVALLAAGDAVLQERLAIDRVVLCVSASSVGAIILLRRPRHGIGLICLAAGILAGAGILGAGLALAGPRGYVNQSVPTIGLLSAIVAPVVAYCLIGPVLLGAFPSGRFGPVGRWLIPLAAIILAPVAVIALVTSPTLDYGGTSTFNPVAVRFPPEGASTTAITTLSLAYVAGLILASAGLVLRYRTAAPTERLQIRLVAANAVAIVLIPVAVILVLALSGYDLDESAGAYLSTAILVIAALVPVCVGVAILRYRLYDIDRIVSNAIGYGVVTVVLFAIFAAVNLVLVTQVSPLVGNEGIAVAASTLLVAALFNPLRTRVQRAVDRRFHRARYDADRLVAAFSGRLRDELDLPTLTRELAKPSATAVEPSTSSVWLRRAERPDR